MKKRILIASGGTGGHFYPGFAIAQELKKRNWQIVFLVKKNDPALPVIEDNNFAACQLDITAFPRTINPIKHLFFNAKLLKSTNQARKIIKDFKPLLTVGMGSYVSFPAALASKFSGIPFIIHESNAKFGIANNLSGYFANKVLLGLEINKNPFARKSLLVGTPVRDFFSRLTLSSSARGQLELKENLPVFLVFGGSQGAKKLNFAVIRMLKKLENKLNKFQIIHITGKRDFNAVKAEYDKLNILKSPNIKIFDYSPDMDIIYAAADIVISRAGASTIAELMQLKKPAFLIPLPSAAADHQTKNAKILSDSGVAVLIKQNDCFEKILSQGFENIIEDFSVLTRMKDNYKNMNMPDILNAASSIADIVEESLELRVEKTKNSKKTV